MNSENEYYEIIKNTQIISIDLILVNENNDILLGKRNNEPAKGMFFSPGCRAFKLESFENAISRISINEIGHELKKGKLHGIYHHNYDNNFKDDLFGTHYINFCYVFNVDSNVINNSSDDKIRKHNNDLYCDQHLEFKWFSILDILSSKDVHLNVKNYFNINASNKIE